MAWNPISGIVPQFTESGDQAIGYVIKFYDVGTLTPQAVATDSTGATTATNFLLDSEGYSTLSGNIIVPHVQSDYKIVLYLNQADADADATGSAVYIIDNLGVSGIEDGSVGLSQLYDIPDANFIIGGTTANGNYPITGDGTVTNTGVFAIGDEKITNAMLAPEVTAQLTVIREVKEGGILSNGADADHDIDIAACTCTDSTASAYIQHAASTIQIDVNIGSGNGGFPSALTLSADTWYRVFICSEADGTNSVGVFDISSTAANAISDLGVDYTLFRRIGWARTDSANNITAFVQVGDSFYWDLPTLDHNSAPTVGSDGLITLTCPENQTGIVNFSTEDAGGSYASENYIYIKRTSQTTQTPSQTYSVLANVTTGQHYYQSIVMNIVVDGSHQINEQALDTGVDLIARTYGWIDDFIN